MQIAQPPVMAKYGTHLSKSTYRSGPSMPLMRLKMQIERRPWLWRAPEGAVEHRRRLTRRRLSNAVDLIARHRWRYRNTGTGGGGAFSLIAVPRS
jgi:hypothetical protein